MQQPRELKQEAKQNESTIDELWRRMTSIYGHKWLSSFGPSDIDGTWARGLAGVSNKEISHGLVQCVMRSKDRAKTGDEDWPPTLGEFRALCTYEKSKPAYHQAYKELSYQESEMTAEQKREVINGLCRSAGIPEKYPQREPGEDDEPRIQNHSS